MRIKKEQPGAILWFKFNCPVGVKWCLQVMFGVSKEQPHWLDTPVSLRLTVDAPGKLGSLTHCQKCWLISYELGAAGGGGLETVSLHTFLADSDSKGRNKLNTKDCQTWNTQRVCLDVPPLKSGPGFWNMGSSLFGFLTLVIWNSFYGHCRRQVCRNCFIIFS